MIMRNSGRAAAILALVTIFLSSGKLDAQNTTGSITGRITDTTGAVVAGVKVTVENLGTAVKRDLVTDNSGDYTATLLLPGNYRIIGERDGFKTSVRTGITLQVDQTVRADMELSVGSATERVEVVATALTLDTDSASIGTTVEQRQVTDLPLNGRSFAFISDMTCSFTR